MKLKVIPVILVVVIKVQCLIFFTKESRFCNRNIDNKFASTSTETRSDRELIKDSIVKPKSATSNLRITDSACWKYIGFLYNVSRKIFIDADENNSASMSTYYCAPCLNEQKALGDKGHISKVANFSRTTSTGTLSLHFSVKHNISEITQPRIGKIMNYLRKYDNCATGTTMSSHELNRDLMIWFCRDLLPFENLA